MTDEPAQTDQEAEQDDRIGLEVGPETADATALKSRIAVIEPYLDLRQLQLGVGMSLSANIPVASSSGAFGGPVQPGEAARHLAILGALALAHVRGDEKRSHYLARRAYYVGVDGLPDSSGGYEGAWRAEATAVADGAREGRAFTRLLGPGGQPVVMLEVLYAVVPERIFARLNADHVRIAEDSPEAIPLPAGDRTVLDDGVRVDIAEVPAAACAGHFPGLPVAPVAVLMGRLNELAGDLVLADLAAGPDSTCYTIDESEVWADELVFAGQDLSFEVELADRVPGGRWIRGRILSGGRVVAGSRMRVGAWIRSDGPHRQRVALPT